jgi:hypothetical protein
MHFSGSSPYVRISPVVQSVGPFEELRVWGAKAEYARIIIEKLSWFEMIVKDNITLLNDTLKTANFKLVNIRIITVSSCFRRCLVLE